MLTERQHRNFWAKVRVNADTGCWEWVGFLLSTGYGQVTVSGRKWATHRLAWTLANGTIAADDTYHGLCVCHRCDNRKCVSPGHLFLGSAGDNTRDAAAKGRMDPRPGERSNWARLTTSQVLEIRERVSAGETQRDLAARFGVHFATVSAIVRRKSWAHL